MRLRSKVAVFFTFDAMGGIWTEKELEGVGSGRVVNSHYLLGLFYLPTFVCSTEGHDDQPHEGVGYGQGGDQVVGGRVQTSGLHTN